MTLARGFLAVTVLTLPLGVWAQSKWIWGKESGELGANLKFSREFELSGHAVSARLQAVSDFSSLKVRVNGKLVGQSPEHGPLLDLDVAGRLFKGKNLVSISARSSGKLRRLASALTGPIPRAGAAPCSRTRNGRSGGRKEMNKPLNRSVP